MAPVAMRANTCEGCLMGKATARRRGVHCGAAPRAPRVAQTVARKVQVKPEQDFANTPNRRYLFPTGDIFPLGPLLYRKTISKQVRSCQGRCDSVVWPDCAVLLHCKSIAERGQAH